MNTRVRHVWEVLTSSYWFLPTVMSLGAVVLAFSVIALDRHYLPEETELGWIYGGGAEGARALLSVIGGSIITVAGVVFSITISTLTQASSQFGPRLLRNFMRDTGNQIVLGTFVATFLYCLLVLRTIQGEETRIFVPHMSITIAVLLAVASLGVLVYFIHHVSYSIQAPHVIAAVSRDFDDAMEHMYPEGLGRAGRPITHEQPDGRLPFDPQQQETAEPVNAAGSGYVQAIETSSLMELVCREDLLVFMRCRPGDFIVEGNPLLLVWPAGRVNDELVAEINGLFILGTTRTAEQDVEFSINQMVEIASRAISPGINDPFTALNCLDWLGRSLIRLAEGDLHSPYRYDDRGKLRAVAEISSFEGLVDAAFNLIRQYSSDQPAVSMRLLETIVTIIPRCKDERQRQILLRHAQMVHRQCEECYKERQDREDLERRYRRVVEEVEVAKTNGGVRRETTGRNGG